MKVAVIGSGIAGMTSAYYLSQYADVTLYEKDSRLGGHTATVDVNWNGSNYAIDTGFIVYNERTYPNFIRLMDELGIASKETSMGFSVSCKTTGLEYAGSNIKTFFAQPRTWFSLSHWQMLRDILRFNKEAPLHLEKGMVSTDVTLGEYLKRFGYSEYFKQNYLVPMGSAIWSASTEVMLNFPMQFFIQFFKNHGLLQVKDRPQWRVLDGGSRSYIPEITRPYQHGIQLNKDVKSLKRTETGVEITCRDGEVSHFDEVIFACHSDQALTMLASEASEAETTILSRMPYAENEVVLHTDEKLLPHAKSTWSSWNYLLKNYHQNAATLTYNMNILQGINAPVTFCVTLNDTDAIDVDKIIGQFQYAHPIFTLDSIAAQKEWSVINGAINTWFCGAYWRNGFHEDGVVSALHVVNGILRKYGKATVTVLDYT